MAFDRFWSPSEPLTGVPADNYQPSLAMSGNTLHLVWSSNRTLYHSTRLANGWSSAVRVAAGEQPSIAATPDGRLHCVFANPFAGNWEIYHVTFDRSWSLPRPVSRTSGASTQPALVAAGDGSLHAVWTDATPGKAVVYYGKFGAESIWASAPLPHGRGCQPSIAIAADGEVIVAWQDRVGDHEAFDVLCSSLVAGAWSLPDLVSDTATAHSTRPSLSPNAQGEVHLVWLEEVAPNYVVCHSDRRVGGWAQPISVSTGTQDCRQARIVTNPQGFLQVIWLEGNALHHRVRPPDPNTPWWVPQTADGVYRELSDLAAVVDRSGALHVVWSGFDDSGSRSLYYAFRQPIFRPAEPKPRQ